tara:strand:+ start:140 stop:715 length:576 start_codon:yes stop_codon:yes gene_type:complete
MYKRISIHIMKNIFLPGSLIGAFMGLYFNLFYFSKSLLKMGGMFSYVVPIIVIAMIVIIMYLSNDKNNQKLIYLMSIPFLPIIILPLLAIFIGRLPLELLILFPFIYLFPFSVASITTIELLKGYYEPNRNHLIWVSIITLVFPLSLPYLIVSLDNSGSDMYHFMAPLYCALASSLYSLPYALYYYAKKNK